MWHVRAGSFYSLLLNALTLHLFSVANLLQSALPNISKVVVVRTFSTIIDSESVHHFPEKAAGEKTTCLFFPNVDGVSVSTYFHLQDFSPKSKNDLGMFFSSLNDVKAIVQFTHNYMTDTTCLLQFLDSHNNKELALGGSVCAGSTNTNKFLHGRYAMYMAFSGNNVTAASIIITARDRSKESIKPHVERLKASVVGKDRSIAFLFNDRSRQNSFIYHDNDKKMLLNKCVEAEILRETFPNAKIIGLYGDAQSGLDSCNEKRVLMSNKEFYNFHMIGSCVIVLISF